MRISEQIHPVTGLSYFIIVLIILMFSGYPFFQAAAFIGGLLALSVTESFRKFVGDFLFYICLTILICITNPLFSHKGVTPLFFLNGKAVTFESLFYGLNLGITISSVIIWFKIFSIAVDREKFLYIFGKTFPKTALLFTMVMGYIPKLKGRYKTLKSAQKGVGLCSSESRVDKIRFESGIFTALCGWSLETSVETSMSMQARGYGLKGRTFAVNFKFRKSDLWFLIFIFVLGMLSLIYLGMGKLNFQCYPEIKFDKPDFIPLAAYGILCFLPFILEVKERLKWNLLLAKI